MTFPDVTPVMGIPQTSPAVFCTSLQADTITVSVTVPMPASTFPAVTVDSVRTVSVDIPAAVSISTVNVPTTVMGPSVVVTDTLVTTSMVTLPAPPAPPADVFTVTVTTTLCPDMPVPPMLPVASNVPEEPYGETGVPDVNAASVSPSPPETSILTLPLFPSTDVPEEPYGRTGVPDVVPFETTTMMLDVTVPVEPTTTTTMTSSVNVQPMPAVPMTTLSTTTVLTTVGSVVRTVEVVSTRTTMVVPEMSILPVSSPLLMRPAAPSTTVVVGVPVVNDVSTSTYNSDVPSTLITAARESTPTEYGGLPNVVDVVEEDDEEEEDDGDEYGGDDSDDVDNDMDNDMDDDSK
ncbi:uncharacterized protein K452DRAFT_316547 [Aplosporella prunicola CBS 121167]|uniref:Uncharacterized protein n=1 Tax=Aplosporella prunicola CBS 121167 TaxID=1176127 RepID=A0A6A6BMT6_9PEZI|nr:uncharacterized protein K452DRAFT_316547 [Aplosporella prunicola CBS 121167]KAF2144575.1 hypothetical protein K452DRAFT_316547 [Aplosporella prunicola CBS 121167]